MVSKKARGVRAKTRYKIHSRGRISPNKRVNPIAEGSTVFININAREQKGMPFRRYQGKTGKVIGKQGDAYLVHVTEGDADRSLIVNPVHLNVMKGDKAKVGKGGV